MKLDELPISNEIINLIKTNAKIFNVQDLIKMSDDDLLKLKGIGKLQLKNIRKALFWFNKSTQIHIEKDDFFAVIQVMIRDCVLPLKHEINELRTILLEQYRLIQSIQIEKQPDGVMKMINEKIPGFSSTMYDIYKKLEHKE